MLSNKRLGGGTLNKRPVTFYVCSVYSTGSCEEGSFFSHPFFLLGYFFLEGQYWKNECQYEGFRFWLHGGMYFLPALSPSDGRVSFTERCLTTTGPGSWEARLLLTAVWVCWVFDLCRMTAGTSLGVGWRAPLLLPSSVAAPCLAPSLSPFVTTLLR